MKDLEISDESYEFPDEVSMDFPQNPDLFEPEYPNLLEDYPDFDDDTSEKPN